MKQTSNRRFVLLFRLLILLLGLATGVLMAGLGTALRIGDAIPAGPLADWFGLPLFAGVGITAGRIGWMLVLEGLFLVAAMCALAVRNHWGWWSTAAAGLIAGIFFPGGTLAGVIVLLAVGVRFIREKPWKKTAPKTVET
jgi:hypothetical protein